MSKIVRMISSYNYSSRGGNSIKYIVLHYTGNKGDTAKNNGTYFSGGNRNASAHYFVDDNEIVQVVEEYNASWAVGDGKGKYGITNQNSISIEMCCNSNGEISEKTEANALELVKYLMNKYNISINNVVRHYDASGKICPNWSSNNWGRWNTFKGKLSYTPGWKQNSTGWWYDLGNGKYPANKWQEINNEWYYFDNKGYAYQNKWLKHKEKWYYFNADCKMVRDCILSINNKYYAFNKDGIMLESTNVNINGNGELVL